MQPSFFKTLGPIFLEDIESIIDCEIINVEKKQQFNGLVGMRDAKEQSLTFLYDHEKLDLIHNTNPTIICSYKSFEFYKSKKLILVKNVQKAVAILSNYFYRNYNQIEINELSKPKIGAGCEISKNAIIENGVEIGENVSIADGVVIKNNCFIGNNTQIDNNTVISNSIIGNNVHIGRNNSIGQSGFGFYINKNQNIKIFHIGRVIIQSYVSIGSGCTIDRGSFSDTLIGENSYLDNLCHIAHNVQIGVNCAFAAMTGIAGSSIIGDNVLTGGQVGIAGHIKVGDNVQIAAKSGVFKSIKSDTSVMGNPAINKYKFLKKYKKSYGN